MRIAREPPTPEHHALAMANRGLIYPAIRRISGRWAVHEQDLRDAFQVGYLALVRAAELWNPKLYAFSTYGSAAIRNAVLSWSRENTVVKVPSHCWDRAKSIAEKERAMRLSFVAPLPNVPDQPDDVDTIVGHYLQPFRAAVAGLPPLERAVMVRRAAGLTIKATAAELGISFFMARHWAHIAAGKIRELLHAGG